MLAASEAEVTLQIKKKTVKSDIVLPRKDVDKARLAIEL